MSSVLTVDQVAKKIGVAPRSLERIVKKPDFPKPLPYKKKNRVWLAADVENWLKFCG
jgi:predicted DNA-binding transcriptional regulator AlpA